MKAKKLGIWKIVLGILAFLGGSLLGIIDFFTGGEIDSGQIAIGLLAIIAIMDGLFNIKNKK